MEFVTQYNVKERHLKKIDPTAKKYKTIPPFARDKDGKFINDSPFPKRVENGIVNMDEFVQSFKEDSDLYCLIEKYIKSGDESFINKQSGFYGDFSHIDGMSYNQLKSYQENFNIRIDQELVKKQAELNKKNQQPTSEASPTASGVVENNANVPAGE